MIGQEVVDRDAQGVGEADQNEQGGVRLFVDLPTGLEKAVSVPADPGEVRESLLRQPGVVTAALQLEAKLRDVVRPALRTRTRRTGHDANRRGVASHRGHL